MHAKWVVGLKSVNITIRKKQPEMRYYRKDHLSKPLQMQAPGKRNSLVVFPSPYMCRVSTKPVLTTFWRFLVICIFKIWNVFRRFWYKNRSCGSKIGWVVTRYSEDMEKHCFEKKPVKVLGRFCLYMVTFSLVNGFNMFRYVFSL